MTRDYAAGYRAGLEAAARLLDGHSMAGWAEEVRALPVPAEVAAPCATCGGTRAVGKNQIWPPNKLCPNCIEPTPAEAIVSRPHPSERGVEKLPPEKVLDLFREAAQHMSSAPPRAEGERCDGCHNGATVFGDRCPKCGHRKGGAMSARRCDGYALATLPGVTFCRKDGARVVGEIQADLTTTKLAIAAREAEVLALRGALESAEERLGSLVPGNACGLLDHAADAERLETLGVVRAALAAPTSTEALREFGLAVVRRTHTAARHMPDAAIVDAVLAGKP